MSDDYPTDESPADESAVDESAVDENPVDDNQVDELLERKIEVALTVLERDDAEVSSAGRPFLETLGMLPYGLEPLEPSADSKRALMAAVEEQGRGGGTVAPGSRGSTAGRSSGWMVRVAAMLAVALLGLSGLQTLRLAKQERQLDQQAERILELQRELEGGLPLAGSPPEWMAASGTELCALTPRQAAGENSKGWLFVRQDHQHWYVAVEALPTAPPGHVYQLWFLVDGELVSGGTFEPDANGRAALTSETMPNPVTGIAVTLEPDDGDGVPSETMVLYGDEVMLVL